MRPIGLALTLLLVASTLKATSLFCSVADFELCENGLEACTVDWSLLNGQFTGSSDFEVSLSENPSFYLLSNTSDSNGEDGEIVVGALLTTLHLHAEGGHTSLDVSSLNIYHDPSPLALPFTFLPGTFDPECGSELGNPSVVPAGVGLVGAYPNPFNPTTILQLRLLKGERVKVLMYNLRGERVKVLHEGYLPQGMHELDCTAEGLPSGIYFATLQSGMGEDTRKLILLR